MKREEWVGDYFSNNCIEELCKIAVEKAKNLLTIKFSRDPQSEELFRQLLMSARHSYESIIFVVQLATGKPVQANETGVYYRDSGDIEYIYKTNETV